MSDVGAGRVAIVDYGLGNLFSIARACEHAGLEPIATSDRRSLMGVDAIVLPGVGAFGSAMEALSRLDLIEPLRDLAATGMPFVGICLGMQLFMTESEEFDRHSGLGLIAGSVVRFSEEGTERNARRMKVPQVGWNRVHQPEGDPDPWAGSLLAGVPNGSHMYFVHSYYAVPVDTGVVVAISIYGRTEFCSGVASGNLFGCQFHPERSGPQGLKLYDNLAHTIGARRESGVTART